MQETRVQSLGREVSLEGMATRFTPGELHGQRLQSTGSQRVGPNWSDWPCIHSEAATWHKTPPIHPTPPSADITNQCWLSSLDEVLDSSLVKFFMCDSWMREKETYLLSPHWVLSSQWDLISFVFDQRSQKYRWYLYSSQSICYSEVAWASQILSISLAW